MGKLVTRLSSTVGVLLFLTIAAAASGEENSPSRGDWIPLFNGRDLNGWTPKSQVFPLAKTTPTRSVSRTAYSRWGTRATINSRVDSAICFTAILMRIIGCGPSIASSVNRFQAAPAGLCATRES